MMQNRSASVASRAGHVLRAGGKKAFRLLKQTRSAKYRQLELDPFTVVYESYAGNGLGCAPRSLFNRLASDPRWAHLRHVWVVDDESAHQAEIRRMRHSASFVVVKRGSAAYWRELSTAGYLINNMTFPPDFVKRPGQIYVNTWHGVPLKKMGYDIPGQVENGKNIVRNLLAADVLLSSTPETTNRLYLGGFRLTNLFRGTILEEGNPRTDAGANPESARTQLKHAYPGSFPADDHRRIVLVAPTWRGGDYLSPQDQAADLADTVATIEAAVDPATTRVLVKAHQVVHTSLERDGGLGSRLVDGDIDTNQLLAVTDVLVTDYSSIFFDFLSTGRPVIHHVPDLAEYAGYRDVYDAPQRWPGTVTNDESTLRAAIGASLAPGWLPSEAYEAQRRKFASRDDGSVAERVVDAVFGEHLDHYRTRERPRDGRETVLMYIGALAPNGITRSASNLLSNIDYDRFDVSVLVPFKQSDPERTLAWNSLDRRARILFKFGSTPGGLGSLGLRVLDEKTGLQLTPRLAELRDSIWSWEWHRLLGDTTFDHVVDYSGYSPFWGRLLTASESETRAIWLHNDLMSDAHRTVAGRKPLYRGLMEVFHNYPAFDHLVSVSEQLSEINRANLQMHAPEADFTWVPNSIDLERVVRQSLEPDPLGTEREGRRFVIIGRISPEKNHERALRAFALVQREHPEARLDILGDGPLWNQVAALISELGLDGLAIMRGRVENPFAWLARAEALVVSSDYEGQPMVILEALTLRRPVVATRFGSVMSAFPEGGGIIVDRDPEDLAAGIRRVLEIGAEAPPFDVERYNSDVVARFQGLFNESAGNDRSVLK